MLLNSSRRSSVTCGRPSAWQVARAAATAAGEQHARSVSGAAGSCQRRSVTPTAPLPARSSATALSTPPLIATATRPGAGSARNTCASALASASTASGSPPTAAASSRRQPDERSARARRVRGERSCSPSTVQSDGGPGSRRASHPRRRRCSSGQASGRATLPARCGQRRLPSVTFDVAAEAYDRFMGRYSVPLAPVFVDFAGVTERTTCARRRLRPRRADRRARRRLGPAAVTAVDPSEPFVAAARERHPEVTVERAAAEDLPFPDGAFDAALAQLVVHFMTDPVAGLREMARVTRENGVVAACVWDHAAGGQGPLSVFWEAATEVDPGREGESQLAGRTVGTPDGALRGRGCPRRRGGPHHGERRAPDVRGVVGAVHARRRAGRRLRRRASNPSGRPSYASAAARSFRPHRS